LEGPTGPRRRDFLSNHPTAHAGPRAEGPHAHGVTLDPANRFAFVCDLGLDKILAYMEERSGTEFDGTVAHAFAGMMREWDQKVRSQANLVGPIAAPRVGDECPG